MSNSYKRLPPVHRNDPKNVKQLVQVNDCVSVCYLVTEDSLFRISLSIIERIVHETSSQIWEALMPQYFPCPSTVHQ